MHDNLDHVIAALTKNGEEKLADKLARHQSARRAGASIQEALEIWLSEGER